MAPPITPEINKLLHKLYYKDSFFLGRDKLFKRAQELNIPVSRRQIMDFLNQQELHQLTLRPNNPITSEISSTVLKRPYAVIGIDLIDYSTHEWKGYKWILTAIDLFSKFAWAIPMKNKTEKETAAAINKLLTGIKHQVSTIRCDNGPEFVNKEVAKVLAKHRVKMVNSLPHRPWVNGQVERMNGILKSMLNKYFIANNNNDWVSVLDRIITNYNSSTHDTTKKVPSEVAKGADNEATEAAIRHRLRNKIKNDQVNFSVGQTVRVKQDAGQRYKWSPELYVIAKVIKPKSHFMKPYYLLSTEDGKKLGEKFYNDDLQAIKDVMNKTSKVERFIISRIIRPAIQKGVLGYIVKWKGWNGEYWQDRELLLEDLPKLVRAFDKKNGVIWYADRFIWNG